MSGSKNRQVTFSQDRKVYVRNVWIEGAPPGDSRLFLRKATEAIAKDMLECGAVEFNKQYDYEHDRWEGYYVFREFRKERNLP